MGKNTSTKTFVFVPHPKNLSFRGVHNSACVHIYRNSSLDYIEPPNMERTLTMKKTRNRTQTPFTQLLNSCLAERKIGVREAARIAGVPQSTVMSWKSGAHPHDFVAVKRLAEKLGTTLSFLLTGEDDSRPKGETPTITEVFADGGMIFDGFAKITVQRLLPKEPKK
jgi:transcriptional regulator with XRE-family HTH domain